MTRFGSSPRPVRRRSDRGAALIEFAFVALALLIVIFAGVEFGRMLLVYGTVANSARTGARYAIVHGATRTGSGVDGPSGPENDPEQVVNVVRNFASAGLVDLSLLDVTVTYPNGINQPGARVAVTVVYPYDPLVSILPLRVNLASTTEGIITF